MKRKKLNGHANGRDHDEAVPKKLPTTVVVVKPQKVAVRPGSSNTNQLRMLNSYDPAVHPKQVLEMAMNGATEREIRITIGVTQPIFDMWRARHSAFAAALAVGPDAKLADDRVQRSLFEMANGYEQPATKIFMHEGVPVAVDYVEHVQKNVAAAKAWLANRDPLNWARNPEHAQPQSAPSVLNVKMIQGMDVEQLKAVVQLLRQALAPITAQSGLKRLDAVDITPEEVKEPA